MGYPSSVEPSRTAHDKLSLPAKAWRLDRASTLFFLLCPIASLTLLADCTVSFGARDPARCGNGLAEGEEVCDGTDLRGAACEDFGEVGTLGCTEDCSLDRSGCSSLCGNGVIDGAEPCDGTDLGAASCESLGYYAGVLACGAACELDTSSCEGRCGDLLLNGDEVCDGTELAGASCESLGFYAGTLGCTSDCIYETGACLGRCGDNVINGPEVCDGMALGGRLCSDSGYAGGPLACLSDCSGLDFSGCWTEPKVVITEVFPGVPDWIEIRNISEVVVPLENWRVTWWGVAESGSPSTGSFTLPIYPLAAGMRVVLEETGAASTDPPIVSSGRILFAVNILWGSMGGAVELYNAASEPHDYVRFCNSSHAPALPAGFYWQDSPGPLPSPGITETVLGLSRIPEENDTDSAGDFCVAEATYGEANSAPCHTPLPAGTLIITEVNPEAPDRVELYNPGSLAVDLYGWRVKYGGTATRLLPTFSLGAGQYAAVISDAPDPEAPFVDGAGVHVGSMSIQSQSGAISLLEPQAHSAVDFLRWGLLNSTRPPPLTSWADNPADLPSIVLGQVLGRITLTDTDTAADFCIQLPSLGLPNTGCL